MADQRSEIWDLWYPKAAATGISFARGRIEAGVTTLLAHALPDVITVTVRDENGQVVAEGQELPMNEDTPISRLTRHGDRIERQDIWPAPDDLGHLVILPGGEVGTLQQWWHAEDHSEWRWQIELYNHR